MSYAKEFSHLFYNVPEFLLTDAGWEDVSWHNDVCPRFENKELGLAVWVEANEPECREYEEWAQYTVVAIKCMIDGATMLCDDELFKTEDSRELLNWIHMYEIKQHIEIAIEIANNMEEQPEEIADGLVSTLEWLHVYMKQNEVPDCSPSGEPC
jgi:hypothetical protein